MKPNRLKLFPVIFQAIRDEFVTSSGNRRKEDDLIPEVPVDQPQEAEAQKEEAENDTNDHQSSNRYEEKK